MTQSDPTDHALATIASILDHPGSHREPERAVAEERPDTSGRVEAEGYSKFGPGPIETIRFKWTVRREDDGHYFVDETIGEDSRPVTNGPMSADAAIRFLSTIRRARRGNGLKRYGMKWPVALPRRI